MKLLLLILLFLNSLFALTLNKEEKEYLEQNKSFTICDHYNTYPISGVKNNKLIGISGDYYNEISKRTGISFKAVGASSFLDLNKKVKNNQCDMVSILAKNQKRFSNMKNTGLVFKFPHVAMGNIKGAFFDDHISYEGHTFIVRVKSFKKYLLKSYPKMKIEVINDLPTILKKIQKDSKTHLIAAKPIIERVIQKNGFDQYKINGVIDGVYTNITLGVDQRHPILLSIINKAIDDIEEIKVSEIISNHSIKEFHIDDKLNRYMLGGLGVLFFLVIVLLYISRAKAKESLLHESEKTKFESLLNNATDGVHIMERNGNVIMCSESFADLLGYTKDEILKLNISDWDKNLPLKKEIYIDKLFEKPKVFTTLYTKKDNSIINVQVNVRSIQLADKTYLYGSSRDITELIRYKELKETKRILDITLDISGVVSYKIDFGSKKLIHTDTLNNLMDIDSGINVKWDQFMEMIHPDDKERIYKVTNEIVQNPKDYELEFRFLTPKKNIKHILKKGTFEFDKEGKPETIYISLQDITKEKNQAIELEKSNYLLAKEKERFELAINGSESGMFDWDIGTDSVYLSSKWKSLIGYEDNEIENSFKEWEKRVHPDDLSLTMKTVEEYFAGKTTLYNATFRMKHKNGQWVWINARGKASRDKEGNPTRMVGFHTDITEVMEYRNSLEKKVQDQIEKLRKNDTLLVEQSKMASMGEMIGNIAHQWRQPLNTISTAASGINIEKEMGSLDDESLKRYTETIDRNSKYLSETIDTFKNFIKGEKNLNNVSIQSEIKQAVSIISSSLKNNYITLIDNVDYEDQIEIYMIKGELSQVIMNILNNSKDILLEKEVDEPWVKLDLINEKNKIIITIEDNAGGIAENIIEKIFEPYFTTKHKSQGTGLGLHMSYKIINESLKGKIWAENSQNGAKFIVELPV